MAKALQSEIEAAQAAEKAMITVLDEIAAVRAEIQEINNRLCELQGDLDRRPDLGVTKALLGDPDSNDQKPVESDEVTYSTVYLGGGDRVSRKWPDKEGVKALYKAGWKAADIAGDYGVDITKVYQCIHTLKKKGEIE